MGTDSVGKQSHASGRTPMFDRAMSEPGVHKVGRRVLWGVCCCQWAGEARDCPLLLPAMGAHELQCGAWHCSCAVLPPAFP